MFLNVIKLEAKVTDSTAKPKSKVISEETAGKVNIFSSECKNKPERNEKEDNTDKKVLNSKPSIVLDKMGKGKQEEVDLKCEVCQYTCKKRNQLNKHMNTKHNITHVKYVQRYFPI